MCIPLHTCNVGVFGAQESQILIASEDEAHVITNCGACILTGRHV